MKVIMGNNEGVDEGVDELGNGAGTTDEGEYTRDNNATTRW